MTASRHRLALAACAFLCAGRAGAVTTGEVWNEVFSADEQRILYAIKADPAAKSALAAGLNRVASSPAASVEAEKRRFQAEWLERIQTFARTYQPGRGQGTKPTPEAARSQVPWLGEIDSRDWGGRLVPALLAKADPQEIGYNIAHLSSLDADDRKAIVDKLALAKTFRYSPDGVADEMLKTGRETMGKVLQGLSNDTPARLRTAKQQLAAAEQALAAARGSGEPTAAAGGSTVFDNARPPSGPAKPPAGPDSTTVVDARGAGQAPPVPPGGALQPAPAPGQPQAGSTLPGAGGPDAAGEIPPPKTPAKGEKTYAAEGKGGGSSIMGALKSPVGKAGIGGALAGAVAGFFLGGPIGALIGLFVGAAAGAGVMMAGSGGSSAAK